jgi:hypothetical protein
MGIKKEAVAWSVKPEQRLRVFADQEIGQKRVEPLLDQN